MEICVIQVFTMHVYVFSAKITYIMLHHWGQWHCNQCWEGNWFPIECGIMYRSRCGNFVVLMTCIVWRMYNSVQTALICGCYLSILWSMLMILLFEEWIVQLKWPWYFLAATKQLYEWFSPSVCLSVRPSVRPSVCHTFLTMFPSSYHHEIFRSYYQWQKWSPCKMSRSEVKGQGHRGHDPNFRFRTVTPVWIHIWWWNDTYSLMLLRRGALLFFKVIRQISRSHGAKIAEFDPDWAFPDCNSSLNSPMAMKCCTKLEVA